MLLEEPSVAVSEGVDGGLLGSSLGVEPEVPLGNGTPVDCGILAAPEGTSTMLLFKEFWFD